MGTTVPTVDAGQVGKVVCCTSRDGWRYSTKRNFVAFHGGAFHMEELTRICTTIWQILPIDFDSLYGKSLWKGLPISRQGSFFVVFDFKRLFPLLFRRLIQC